MKKSVKKLAIVWCAFDDLEVLSCQREVVCLGNGTPQKHSDYVVLKCNADGEDAVVYIERSMYLKMVDQFLEEKKGFYIRYKHWCGRVTVDFTYAFEMKPSMLNSWMDDKMKKKKVRTFMATAFTFDSEHG